MARGIELGEFGVRVLSTSLFYLVSIEFLNIFLGGDDREGIGSHIG